MSDSPLRVVPNQPSESTQDQPARDEMAELRRLLIEPEQNQINNILERLNNPRVRAREMSRSLPEAIRLRTKQDESLREALTPTIVTAFQNSIKKDPGPVAEAISPLMGPAIRRAITNALSAFIQSFDQVLKHSFSWQGLKWRLEAYRTGRLYTEVVLYHTLVYRVEEVFLIHKNTGLLLQHVAAKTVFTKDADIVSGMLTAIQDAIRNFAHDSFDAVQDKPIEKIDFGDFEVWIEQGPKAALVVAIRGNAPEELRKDCLAPVLEAIHYEQREALDSFDGDVSPFEMSRGHLEDCLQSRYREQQQPGRSKLSTRFKIVATAILAGIGVLAFLAVRSYWRWTSYVDRLKSEPGIVIIEDKWRFGWKSITGLRDPLSADPEAILRRQTKINPASVTGRWEQYQALHPDFILERAKSLLTPPPTVSLKFENGSLVAAGSAPHQWIVEARKLVRASPGIAVFREDNLIDSDFKTAKDLIENKVLRFATGTTRLVAGQGEALRQLTAETEKLITLAAASDKSVQIKIVGHTSTEGVETTNMWLSQERAAKILSALSASGINQSRLEAVGVGSSQPIRVETTTQDRQFNRSVSFKVALNSAPQQKVSHQ